MYAIFVDFVLVAVIVTLGILLFAVSVFVVLVDAVSEAVARAARRSAHAVARFQQQAPRPDLQPDESVARARLHL